MVGISIVRHVYDQNAKVIVNWFPTLTIILLIWLLVPVISLFVSALVYELIKRVVLIRNAKIRSLIITPYLSGAVFMIYSGFIFNIRSFHNIPNELKV